MPAQYIPILIFALLAAAFPAVTLLIFKFIRPDMHAVGAKLKPYECGVPAEGDARGRYSVRFYIIAILFVVFDVEIIYLYPWAIIFGQNRSPAAFYEMLIFLVILTLGLVYAWRKGALEWV
jgi:NADH-quinone oxidoreductase subunit A